MSDLQHVAHSLKLLHKWQKQRKQALKERKHSQSTANPRIAVLEQLTSRQHRPREIDTTEPCNDENKAPATPHSAKLKLLKARHSGSHTPVPTAVVRRNSSPHTLPSNAPASPGLPDRQISLPLTAAETALPIAVPPALIIPVSPLRSYHSDSVKSPLKSSSSTKPLSAGITRTNKHVKSISVAANASPTTQQPAHARLPSLSELSSTDIYSGSNSVTNSASNTQNHRGSHSNNNTHSSIPRLPVREVPLTPAPDGSRRKPSISRSILQLRAERLKLSTGTDDNSDDDNKQSSSDDDDKDDKEQVEYGYLMNRRRFTNWISHKQLLKQRKDSMSGTPVLSRQESTAAPHKDSVSARMGRWAMFQVKMHQFVHKWRKQQAQQGSKPMTPTAVTQLKRMESDFLSFDVTEQLMSDQVEYVTDSPIGSVRGQAKFLQAFDAQPIELADAMTVSEVGHSEEMHSAELVHSTVDHVRGQHIRTDTPIDSLAPIDIHDYIDTSNHTAEPAQDDILRYAKYLQYELPSDEPLLYVAKQALKSPVPQPWRIARAFNTLYYVNTETQETQFTDPADNYYFLLFNNEKQKYWEQRLQKCFLKGVEQRTVDCSSMLITDTIFEYLCNMLKHACDDIQCIDVSHNMLTDVSVSKLCKLLQNTTHSIHTIKLSHNRIGAHSILKLHKLCTYSNIVLHINLADNTAIGAVGCERIAKLLGDAQCSLQSLNISNTGIADVSIQYLVDVLQFSKSLLDLNVSGNSISSDSIDKLHKAAALCKHQINITV